jgi:hypothetical protein
MLEVLLHPVCVCTEAITSNTNFLLPIHYSAFTTTTLSLQLIQLTTCSFGWWLTAGADLFSEKSTVDWLRSF